jgi:hypothetical protein
MPYVRTTNFDPTTVASAAAVQGELDAAREYVRNGIVNADVNAGAVTTSRIYKPESYGFPRRATIGTINEAAGRHHGVSDRPAILADTVALGGTDPWLGWLFVTDRATLHTEALDADQRVVVPGMAIRQYIEAPCAVDIAASWSFAVMYDDTVLGSARYPGTGGFPGGDFAGAFQLKYQNIDPRSPEVLLGHTRRKIYPHLNGAGGAVRPRADHCTGEVVELTTDGVYDFWLEYFRFGADAGMQVAIGMRNFVVEVFKT